MILQTKHYKYLKIKKHFRYNNFLLIYNESNVKDFIAKNQKLKRLDLCSFKIYNTLTRVALKQSIYKNFQSLMSSLTILVKLNSKNSYLSFNKLLKLDESLHLIGLKMNNKIYPISKIRASLQLDYRKNHLVFVKFLKTNLKNFYKISK